MPNCTHLSTRLPAIGSLIVSCRRGPTLLGSHSRLHSWTFYALPSYPFKLSIPIIHLVSLVFTRPLYRCSTSLCTSSLRAYDLQSSTP